MFSRKPAQQETKVVALPSNALPPVGGPKPVGQLVEGRGVIESIDDLPRFECKLYDVINMRASIRHLVCPVQVSSSGDRKTYAIICLRKEVDSDIVKEILRLLTLQKFTRAEVWLYVTTPQVLVELARDRVNDNKRTAEKNNSGSLIARNDSALYQLFESVVQFALANNSSDIHFKIVRTDETSQIRFRIEGILTSPSQFRLPTSNVLDTVSYLFNVHGKSTSEPNFNENRGQQCNISMTINQKKLLFRWASEPTVRGIKVVLRVLLQDGTEPIRPLAKLGYFDMQIQMWMRCVMKLGGGTLLSGVVGSGKSTTMQTLLSMLPEHWSIYTVEDPVEYIIPNADQFSISRQLSESKVDPFLSVKRNLKRMDPDVVLIGETRDHESGALFRDIVESGHRGFTTIHAPSAIDMITLRLVSEEIAIPHDVIATPGFLNLLVYQALIPRLCENCKRPAKEVYSAEYMNRIERLFDFDVSKMSARNECGCSKCERVSLPELNGIRDRSVVAEMIEPDSIMLDLFRKRENAGLKEYIKGLQTAGYDEPDSTGKSAMEVAVYNISQGIFDPHFVEMKFGSFIQYENSRKL